MEEHELADGTLLEIRSIPLPDGGLVQTFTDITTRRANEAHAERLASEDPLTGLLNRRVFRAALEDDAHADAAHAPAKVAPASTHKDGASVRIAVMFLDLDRFKVINDALGHRTGDLLLKEVAERLRAAIGPDDVLARLGGDEFAVAMREPGSRTKIAARAQRLLDAITPPFEIEGYHVRTGASIGIALGPFDGHDADDLMKAADLALYAMKSESRGGFKFYNPAMSAQLCERREIETDLRAAIERGDLQLHYQPIINLQENCISGFEALARWRHTTKGMIPPAQFIPIAEDSGLIMAIGKWALEEACRQASCWPGDTKIAVNLSPIQLLIPDLPERIAGLLKETGLAPHRLEIEITEQTVLSDDENTIATLHRLKDLGVRIAMDDFGTGYSSLSYLRTFPFDKIKIDRGFVSDLGRGPEHAIIVQAVISIAHALGMTTTAEGVEADRQREFLTALGCEEAQGYLFSHAITGDEVDAMLSTWGYRAMRAA